jgi:isopenicillin N synthase-like dioxygenase
MIKSFRILYQAYYLKNYYSTSQHSTQNTSIPIIDLTKSYENLTYRKELAEHIDEICQNIGFFIITGHLIDAKIQEDMMKISKEFFHLPLSIKREITGSKSYPYGYNGLNDENLSLGYDKSSSSILLSDLKESFSIGPEHEQPIRWPTKPLSMSSIWLNYYKQCQTLSEHLYKLFALALHLDQHWFDNKINEHRSALRSLYYPSFSSPLPKNQYRSSVHTDYGSFTILKQDSIPGLQVQNRYNGKWIDVPFIENSFVINLGDLMSRWTNDHWISTPHRVIAPANKTNEDFYPSRQSIAYFCQINPNEIVTCIPTCSSKDKPSKYPPIRSWDLIMEKYLASTQKNKI